MPNARGDVYHVAFGNLEFPSAPELWPLLFLGSAIIDPIHPLPTEEGSSRPVQDDVDVPFGGVDLGLGIAGPVDDLDVVMSIVILWQCSQVDELGTEYARSVTEFSLEFVLKLGIRLRIPMDVFSGTWLDRDTVERILCEHARGNFKACENREEA